MARSGLPALIERLTDPTFGAAEADEDYLFDLACILENADKACSLASVAVRLKTIAQGCGSKPIRVHFRENRATPEEQALDHLLHESAYMNDGDAEWLDRMLIELATVDLDLDGRLTLDGVIGRLQSIADSLREMGTIEDLQARINALEEERDEAREERDEAKADLAREVENAARLEALYDEVQAEVEELRIAASRVPAKPEPLTPAEALLQAFRAYEQTTHTGNRKRYLTTLQSYIESCFADENSRRREVVIKAMNNALKAGTLKLGRR